MTLKASPSGFTQANKLWNRSTSGFLFTLFRPPPPTLDFRVYVGQWTLCPDWAVNWWNGKNRVFVLPWWGTHKQVPKEWATSSSSTSSSTPVSQWKVQVDPGAATGICSQNSKLPLQTRQGWALWKKSTESGKEPLQHGGPGKQSPWNCLTPGVCP